MSSPSLMMPHVNELVLLWHCNGKAMHLIRCSLRLWLCCCPGEVPADLLQTLHQGRDSNKEPLCNVSRLRRPSCSTVHAHKLGPLTTILIGVRGVVPGIVDNQRAPIPKEAFLACGHLHDIRKTFCVHPAWFACTAQACTAIALQSTCLQSRAHSVQTSSTRPRWVSWSRIGPSMKMSHSRSAIGLCRAELRLGQTRQLWAKPGQSTGLCCQRAENRLHAAADGAGPCVGD